MGSITLMVVAAKEGELSRLQESYRQHIRDSVRDRLQGLRKQLDQK
jgi:hypothetical protein